MSTAEKVREHIAHTPVRRFVRPSAIAGSRRAVECEMSRLAAEGDIVRVRKGLYWKGPKTRAGMPLPRPIEIALQVGGPGSGLAGVSAAHALGLTTQVPATEQVAVPGRAPSPVPGVRFVSRSIERRITGLHALEVALLEVLRAGPSLVEARWAKVAETARRLAASGEIRPEAIGAQLPHEHHVAARQRWAELALTETVSA